VPAQELFAQSFGASELYLLAYAAVFLVIMLFLPRGILPSIRERLNKKRAAAAGAARDAALLTERTPSTVEEKAPVTL
jgi:branched-chain amino acid transport system permease protein